MAGSSLTDSSAASDGLQTVQAAAAGVSVKRSRIWVEAIFIAWLLWLYDMLANLAPLRRVSALRHAWAVFHFERAIAIDPELALNHWLAAQHALGLALSDYYDNAHFIVTLGLLGWIWWRRPDAYRPLRNTLVLINLVGFAVFWLYPMAPPRMLTAAGFKDIVAATHAFGSWHTGSLASEADQYAAMPSLHMAWAAWVAVAVWRISSRRWLRALGVLHVVLTAVAVLATGNHFVIDVLAGLATAALSAAAIRLLGGAAARRAAMRWAPSLAPVLAAVAGIAPRAGAAGAQEHRGASGDGRWRGAGEPASQRFD